MGKAVRDKLWSEVKTDRFWFDEVWLFLNSINFCFQRSECWQKRCDDWETHVNIFACLKCEIPPREVQTNVPQDPIRWKATRIEFLFEHLNILDTKFGILLTFNSLLLVAINVLVNVLFNLLKKDGSFAIPPNSDSVISWTVKLSILFGISWLLTTIICLSGERRLVWGDLGLNAPGASMWRRLIVLQKRKDRADDRLEWGSIEDKKDREAEDKHVTALIIAVAKRTNKFRVAIRLTFVNVVLLAATFTTALSLLSRAYPHIAF